MSSAGAEVGDLLPFASNIFWCQGLVRGEMNASGAFPTDPSSETWSNFEESASRKAFIGTEEDNCWGNVFRLEFGNLSESVSEAMIQNVPLPRA